MDLLISDVIEVDSSDSFVTGKYSDFSVKLNFVTFKIHKIVVCSKSKCFENLCGARYIEGQRGFGELEDTEDPAMIARMFQVMYQANYGTATHETQLAVLIRNSLFKEAPIALAAAHIDRVTFLTHANMYAMADRYEFPLLSALAKSKFVAAIHEPGFSLEDLVSAIEAVYSTTPDENDGLRKHVVYMAQSHMQAIKNLDSFVAVYEKFVGFCWDFGLEYGARKTVWCPSCQMKSKIPASCSCGFHGLCGTLKACTESSWATLKCSVCKKAGALVREKPNEDDDLSIVGGGKRETSPASSMETRSAKKRKSTL